MITQLQMPKFIPGLELSKLFYQKEVKPILNKEFAKIHYSAALIGWGSEVLGFDSPLSRDHHWGPRVLLFLSEEDFPRLKEQINESLSKKLPCEFMGYSTNYSKPESNGVRYPVKIDRGPVNHMVNIYTTRLFFEARLGLNPGENISVADWLTSPQQRLLELTSGEVFHDGLRELKRIRRKLRYYPKDIWLYMLAAQWTRISQEEAFLGRVGDLGDELGSQIIAARMVREIVKLAFLMERRYAPYSKWLGIAFSKLEIAGKLTPVLRQVLKAGTWKDREKWISKAYTIVAEKHNELRITKALSSETTYYFSRPFVVINADRFARALRQSIRDSEVRKIKTSVGSIDQFTDSTDVIEDLKLGAKLRTMYK